METIHPGESPKPDYAFIYAKLARHVAVADALLASNRLPMAMKCQRIREELLAIAEELENIDD